MNYSNNNYLFDIPTAHAEIKSISSIRQLSNMAAHQSTREPSILPISMRVIPTHYKLLLCAQYFYHLPLIDVLNVKFSDISLHPYRFLCKLNSWKTISIIDLIRWRYLMQKTKRCITLLVRELRIVGLDPGRVPCNSFLVCNDAIMVPMAIQRRANHCETNAWDCRSCDATERCDVVSTAVDLCCCRSHDLVATSGNTIWTLRWVCENRRSMKCYIWCLHQNEMKRKEKSFELFNGCVLARILKAQALLNRRLCVSQLFIDP